MEEHPESTSLLSNVSLIYPQSDDDDEDEDDGAWRIPPPSSSTDATNARSRQGFSATGAHESRPLRGGGTSTSTSSNSFSSARGAVGSIFRASARFGAGFGDTDRRRGHSNSSIRNLLFGEGGGGLDFETNFKKDPYDHNGKPSGLAGFFFGFMYEEPLNESIDWDDDHEDAAGSATNTSGSVWNTLNLILFASYTCTTIATTVPVVLIPTISQDLFADESIEASSAFTSQVAASAIMGTACGKFLNGPVGDVFGARRTQVIYSTLLALSLASMTFCTSTSCVASACFFVEFFQSVQWPCILVILATHYQPKSHILYEGGIYATSIASRFGSLVGIPLASYLLKRSHWRVVSLIGAWVAMIGCSVSYLFCSDAPNRVNAPQNPLPTTLLQQIENAHLWSRPKEFVRILGNVVSAIVFNNLIPSLKHVLKSGTFWIVALAHTGSSMIRSSERILGTYFRDTSMGTLSENRAAGLAVFSSIGTILGITIAGAMFTSRKERQRKWLVSRLYKITIGACYMLAILAIPAIRYTLDAPGLVLFFQVLSTFVMSFGVAVMFYHIPGLVGAAFGHDKGLFSAYTDGVAYGLASIVWRIVANSVQGGDPQGSGWAYGWAAVALLIILCAVLMVEFMEHYFVRAHGKHRGSYETIIFA